VGLFSLSPQVLAQRIAPDAVSLRRNVLLRYKGTDTAIPVEFTGDVQGMTRSFEALYRARFGFASEGKALVVETAAVEAVGDTGNARRSVGGARHSVASRRCVSLLPPRQTVDYPAWFDSGRGLYVVDAGTGAAAGVLELLSSVLVSRRANFCPQTFGHRSGDPSFVKPDMLAAGGEALGWQRDYGADYSGLSWAMQGALRRRTSTREAEHAARRPPPPTLPPPPLPSPRPRCPPFSTASGATRACIGARACGRGSEWRAPPSSATPWGRRCWSPVPSMYRTW